ncbi:MAG: hypothetical protein Q9163_000132 [Psora crenata]
MNAPSTNLRPRNRRRAYEEGENGLPAPPSVVAYEGANSDPAASSMRISPISSTCPSEGPRKIQDGRSRSRGRFLRVPGLVGSHGPPSTYASGLWESSWSSLRGIASDLIGSDGSRASSPGQSPIRKRSLMEGTYRRNTSTNASHWGPMASGDTQLASGTEEDHVAKVQAKKRETLLVADRHIAPDSSGRYKRRGSDDRERFSSPIRASEDRDALVYVHKVKPGDTLAGVTIKYNCQPNVFQRANRLWPNDSIQVRKTVVLPVDACGVRGRKVPDTEFASLNLTKNQNEEVTGSSKTVEHSWGDLQGMPPGKETTPLSSVPTSPSISIALSNPEEPPWKHESWVMIDGFLEAVEIARLSRRALGYFPPSRRKSQSISDVETPSTSLELPRPSYQSNSSRQQTRSRSSSNSFLATHLQGPGGVGTMSKNVRGPGPANDGLNKLFPNLQPTVAPRRSFELQQSNSPQPNGLENVGGAIEGWVRKLATKASASLQPPTHGGGSSGVGDLIELSEDAFEFRKDTLDGGRKKGEEGWREATRFIGPELGVAAAWSAEQERTMEERFPPRGRVIDKVSTTRGC